MAGLLDEEFFCNFNLKELFEQEYEDLASEYPSEDKLSKLLDYFWDKFGYDLQEYISNLVDNAIMKTLKDNMDWNFLLPKDKKKIVDDYMARLENDIKNTVW